jgi:hypothetical protein
VSPLRPPVIPLPPVVRPPVGPIFPLVTVAAADLVLADIPTGLPFFPDDGQVHAVRVEGAAGTRRYAVWIPAQAPITLETVLESPDGRTARATGTVQP